MSSNNAERYLGLLSEAVGGICYLADLAARSNPGVNAAAWHEWNGNARAAIDEAVKTSRG